MLDSIGEVKAFKILSDAGISTPESITISRAASVKASSLASAIQGIVHADKTYPDSVSAWTTQLLGFLNSSMRPAKRLHYWLILFPHTPSHQSCYR